MRQIIIDKGIFETRLAVMADGQLEDFRVDKIHSESNVGKIYKGRVVDVIQGMDAAFVDIGLDKNAYLSKMDMVRDGRRGRKQDPLNQMIKAGEEIFVEVVKDASGSKGAKVTMRLSLTGDSMVLLPEEVHVGISKKISDAGHKERIESWIKASPLTGYGLIVRTSAVKKTDEALDEELDQLLKRWDHIKSYKVLGKAPMCLYSGKSFSVQALRSELKNKVDLIISNDQSILEDLKTYLKTSCPEWLDKVKLYRESFPIFESYKVNEALKKLSGRVVEIAGGASLVIEETEALTVIDVNSGQNIGKQNIEKTAFAVNSSAAKAVAKLMKVRELSGIILVDFIDMTEKDMENKLIRSMEKAVLADRNRVTIHGITTLGIMEITRKKSVDSIYGKLKDPCPICRGQGFVPAADTMTDDLIKDMVHHRNHTDADCILYEVPEHLEAFMHQHRDMIHDACAKIGFKLFIARGNTPSFKRLRADSEEKLKVFAKKTGNFELNHI